MLKEEKNEKKKSWSFSFYNKMWTIIHSIPHKEKEVGYEVLLGCDCPNYQHNLDKIR